MIPPKFKHEDGNESTASKASLVEYRPSGTLVVADGTSVRDGESILHIVEGNGAVGLILLLENEGGDIRHWKGRKGGNDNKERHLTVRQNSGATDFDPARIYIPHDYRMGKYMMMAQGLSHAGLHLNRRMWKRDASGLRSKIAQGDNDMVTYIGQPQQLRAAAWLCVRVNVDTFP